MDKQSSNIIYSALSNISYSEASLLLSPEVQVGRSVLDPGALQQKDTFGISRVVSTHTMPEAASFTSSDLTKSHLQQESINTFSEFFFLSSLQNLRCVQNTLVIDCVIETNLKHRLDWASIIGTDISIIWCFWPIMNRVMWKFNIIAMWNVSSAHSIAAPIILN